MVNKYCQYLIFLKSLTALQLIHLPAFIIENFNLKYTLASYQIKNGKYDIKIYLSLNNKILIKTIKSKLNKIFCSIYQYTALNGQVPPYKIKEYVEARHNIIFEYGELKNENNETKHYDKIKPLPEIINLQTELSQ